MDEIQVERLKSLDEPDLLDLCEATDAAILDGGGFGFVSPPERNWLERYWQGVLLVPERSLFVARREGAICGSVQMVSPPRNNEAQKSIVAVQHLFVAPWARGIGVGSLLMRAVEGEARTRRFKVINLDVRETQTQAIAMYESLGYRRLGRPPEIRQYSRPLGAGDLLLQGRAGCRKTARRMIVFPAIDLKDGSCVRLVHGDMGQVTVFNDDPADQAGRFEQAGFSWLHLVDLNGAVEGGPVNADAVEAVLAAVGLPVQLGGGIRDMATIEMWLGKGVRRVVLGTAALSDPELVRSACRRFPGRIVVGIDARDGMVATSGWTETSETPALDLALRFEDAGVAAIVFTDIARDGALGGVNMDATVDPRLGVDHAGHRVRRGGRL